LLSRFIISSLFFVFFCGALFADEEIRVELGTEPHLSALYLSHFEANEAAYSRVYLEKLRKTLAFDLHYSGYAKVYGGDANFEKALANRDLQIAFAPGKWERAGLGFVVKVDICGEKLDLYALSVSSSSLKQFEGISLTGTLRTDRQQIHKLADALVETLFGGEGIASSRILYSLQEENPSPNSAPWRGEIWECDWDGQNARQVTFENDYSITPAFLPSDPVQGEGQFLYVNYKNGQPKIYFSSLVHRTGRPLLPIRGNQLLPAVSPKRDQIAFICDAAGRPDLFVQKIDASGQVQGKPKQLFSYPRATQASPTFSPDGSRLAFVSDKNGSPRIYVIPSDEPSQRRPIPTLLTKISRENTGPSWSPDGTKIAYSAKTNGVRQIWIYDFIEKEERQLTTGPGNKENPCWAPDSLHLVFNSTDPGSSELFLVNLNQPEALQITRGQGKKHYPNWGNR